MNDPLHATIAWLSTLTVTKPFTLEDADTIKRLIKGALPKAIVDVNCPLGTAVYVSVEIANTIYTRTLDVVG